MKSFTIAAIVISATLASAQLSALPPCAITCATGSLGATGCGLTDVACICKATSFITGLTTCVEKACTTAEVEQAGQAAVNLCASAGVTITLPSAPAAPAPVAPSTAAPAPVAPSSSAPAPVAPSSAPASVYSSSSSSAPAVVSPPVYYTSSSSSAVPTTMATSTSTCTSTGSTTIISLTKTSTIPLATGTGSSYPTGNATAPSTPSMPAIYTGAASSNTVGGLSALFVAVVAGLVL